MFNYILPADLLPEDWSAIKHSFSAAPPVARVSDAVLWENIQGDGWKVFRIRGGLVVVTIQEYARSRRLVMLACSSKRGMFGFTLRRLGKDLQRLASDWACDTIETLCYDVRHAKAIIRAGGRIESLTMTLKAKD